MNTPASDSARPKRIGVLNQKQKDLFVLRLRALAGDLSASQLKIIADAAEKYGRAQVHLSTRQGVEIHNVHGRDVEKAVEELAAAGIRLGANGPHIRVITACPGAATCRWGIIDTKEIAADLDAKYFCRPVPHKFKMAVTGCPNNCAKATANDLGVMGGIIPRWSGDKCTDCGLCVLKCPAQAISKKDARYVRNENTCILCGVCTKLCPTASWTADKQGYRLSIGGTLGKFPRLGNRLEGLITDKDQLAKWIERAVHCFTKNAKQKERFGRVIDRIGLENVKKEIIEE